MTRKVIFAETLALKRPNLLLRPDDIIGETDFLDPKSHSGAAAVIKDRSIVGILTERDLLKRVLAKGLDPKTVLVKDVMTANPVTISAEATLKETLNIIINSGFRYLPVVKETHFVGIIDIRDLYMEMQKIMEDTLEQERTLFANMMSEPYGIGAPSSSFDASWP